MHINLLPILLAAAACATAIPAAAKSHPVARGTFIQHYLVRGWTDAQWQAEFRAMKELGMDILIFGDTADGKDKVTYYPTSIPGFRQAEGHDDTIENCLRNAKKANIKVFFGLNFNGDWWRKAARDPEWLFGQMREGNAIADELYARYKKRYPKNMYGWYWVWEVDNLNYNSPEHMATLAKAIDINVRHLHALDRSMPVMLCPFMNHKVGEAQPYADLWKYVFANTDLGKGDIFAPQDCIGAGGLNLDIYQDWFARLKKAVDSKPGLSFWVDTETFVQEDWTAGTIDRFVRQLKDLRPYVKDYVTFAYSHYYSPNNTAPGYHETLKQYVKTGTLESEPPTAPTNLQARRQEDGSVILTWDAAKDNVGVCGYEIYRNGTRISRHQVPRHGEKPGFQPTLFVDKEPTSILDLSYDVVAYDFAGNKAPRLGPVVVKGQN